MLWHWYVHKDYYISLDNSKVRSGIYLLFVKLMRHFHLERKSKQLKESLCNARTNTANRVIIIYKRKPCVTPHPVTVKTMFAAKSSMLVYKQAGKIFWLKLKRFFNLIIAMSLWRSIEKFWCGVNVFKSNKSFSW